MMRMKKLSSRKGMVKYLWVSYEQPQKYAHELQFEEGVTAKVSS